MMKLWSKVTRKRAARKLRVCIRPEVERLEEYVATQVIIGRIPPVLIDPFPYGDCSLQSAEGSVLAADDTNGPASKEGTSLLSSQKDPVPSALPSAFSVGGSDQEQRVVNNRFPMYEPPDLEDAAIASWLLTPVNIDQFFVMEGALETPSSESESLTAAGVDDYVELRQGEDGTSYVCAQNPFSSPEYPEYWCFPVVLDPQAAEQFVGDYLDLVVGAVQDNWPVTVQFSSSSYYAGESWGSAYIDVTLSAPLSEPVYVDYQSSDGSAVAGADYQSVSGTVTFEPWTISQSFTVPIVNDTEIDANEYLNLELTYAYGGVHTGDPLWLQVEPELGELSEASVHITDDDPTPPPPPPPPPIAMATRWMQSLRVPSMSRQVARGT